MVFWHVKVYFVLADRWRTIERMSDLSVIRAPEALYRGGMQFSVRHTTTAAPGRHGALLCRSRSPVACGGAHTHKEKPSQPDKSQQTEKVHIDLNNTSKNILKQYQQFN